MIKIKDKVNSIMDEIQILMFTRAQVTIIPSFYAQLFNHITSIQPRFKKMSKWLETNFFEVLTDSKIIFNYNKNYRDLKGRIFEYFTDLISSNNVE